MPTINQLINHGRLAARFVGEGRTPEIEEAVTRLQEGLPPAHVRPVPDLP